MHLYQASPAHAADLPLLIFEVLKDDAHPPSVTWSGVTRNGIIHADRIPQLSKVYVVEPALKQVVVSYNLHEVSRVSVILFAQIVSPSVVPRGCALFLPWLSPVGVLEVFLAGRWVWFVGFHQVLCSIGRQLYSYSGRG